MTDHDIILKALDVYYAYPAEEGVTEESHAALDGLCADIKRGTFTAVIGHNGSGKSTLAKLLSAMLFPDKGSVTVYKVGSAEGLDSKDESKNFEIRKTVGMVFQNPDNQLVATIVEDDVAFAPENLGLEPKEMKRLPQSVFPRMPRMIRINYPAGRNSALPLPACLPWNRNA